MRIKLTSVYQVSSDGVEDEFEIAEPLPDKTGTTWMFVGLYNPPQPDGRPFPRGVWREVRFPEGE